MGRQLRGEVHEIGDRTADRQERALLLPDGRKIRDAVADARVVSHAVEPFAQENLVLGVRNGLLDRPFQHQHLSDRCLRGRGLRETLLHRLNAIGIAEGLEEPLEMGAAVVLQDHLRCEELALRDRTVRADLTERRQTDARIANAIHGNRALKLQLVIAVVRHRPAVLHLQLGGDDAVSVLDILRARVVVEDILDVLHRHRDSAVLGDAEDLLLLRVHRDAEVEVRTALRRAVHHLVRGEEPEHAVWYAEFRGEALVESIAQLIGFVPHTNAENPVVRAVQHLGKTLRGGRNRLEAVSERGFTLRGTGESPNGSFVRKHGVHLHRCV